MPERPMISVECYYFMSLIEVGCCILEDFKTLILVLFNVFKLCFICFPPSLKKRLILVARNGDDDVKVLCAPLARTNGGTADRKNCRLVGLVECFPY